MYDFVSFVVDFSDDFLASCEDGVWEKSIGSPVTAIATTNGILPYSPLATNSYPGAFNDFYGLPSNPVCVYRTGKEWPVPKSTQAQRIPRELRPVCDHPSSTNLVRLAEKKGVAGPLHIWIGALPGTLSFEKAEAAAVGCKEILLAAQFADVEIAFRESVHIPSAGSRLPDCVLWRHPTADIRAPFTGCLRVQIAACATPDVEGTGALYLCEGGEADRVFLLTTRHVALPPSVYPNRHYGHRNTGNSQHKVLILGSGVCQDALETMVTTIEKTKILLTEARCRLLQDRCIYLRWFGGRQAAAGGAGVTDARTASTTRRDGLGRTRKHADEGTQWPEWGWWEGLKNKRENGTRRVVVVVEARWMVSRGCTILHVHRRFPVPSIACASSAGSVSQSHNYHKRQLAALGEIAQSESTIIAQTRQVIEANMTGAQMAIIRMNDFHTDVTKHLSAANQRALIEVGHDKINWDTFEGNVIQVGSKISAPDFACKLRPHSNCASSFDYPDGGLLQIKGTLQEDEIGRRCSLDEGSVCLTVVKYGKGTGLTVGRETGLELFVQEYDNDGINSTSIAMDVYPYSCKGGAFSGPGDSGSIVVDGLGHIVGMVPGSAGRSQFADVTYLTPYYWIEECIKQVFPNRYLYPVKS
ncbi:hypothetical protein RhiJN_10052 [Ceratobasidium sp. AG-Ba]|nr:hypothetical protein RhiJN_10052 [Ceratobasidium sp. AG-Ba]